MYLMKAKAIHPAKPRNLRTEDLAATGATLKWNNQSDAKAYLVRWQSDGTENPNQPIYYLTDASLALNKTLVGVDLAGLTFNFAVKALANIYESEDPFEAGQVAIKAEPEDNWAYLEVVFPTE